MSKRREPPLAFLDLETTGADERTGEILEVAVVVTDPAAPFVELGEFTRIIRLYRQDWRSLMDDTVTAMHAANGLAIAVDACHCPLRVAETQLFAFLDQFEPPLRLAGSGVAHFDRRWLKAHMPRVEAMFDYPSMDVGPVRRLIRDYAQRKDLVPELDGSKPHRALADARLHLTEFRHYAALIAALPEAAA